MINNQNFLFYKNKNYMGALSGNAIYELNIRDLVDNILLEYDNNILLQMKEIIIA